MKTNHVIERLLLWVEGDLSAQEMSDVHEHLNQCESCRVEAEALQESQTWLKAAALVPFDEADRVQLRQQVMASIRAEGQAHNVRTFHPWRTAMVAAAAGILCVLLPRFFRHSTEPTAKPETAPVQTANNTAANVVVPAHAVRVVRHAQVRHRHTEPENDIEPASGPSRIEIQTENPNIRIIWLARAEPEPSAADGSINSN